MIKSLKKFVANESGATAIEYALIASLVAVAIIAALSAHEQQAPEHLQRSRRQPEVISPKSDVRTPCAPTGLAPVGALTFEGAIRPHVMPLRSRPIDRENRLAR